MIKDADDCIANSPMELGSYKNIINIPHTNITGAMKHIAGACVLLYVPNMFSLF
jgi:hypothetical protein